MTRSDAASASPPLAWSLPLAFALGGALIVFPAAGTIALLLAAGRRALADRRRALRSVPWEPIAAAVLVAASSALVGRPDLPMALQIAAFGLLVGAGIVLGRTVDRSHLLAGLGGVTAGLALAAALSIASLLPGPEGALALVGVASVAEAAPGLRRVSGWLSHPNFWGAAAIAPTTLAVALQARARRPAWAAAALAAGLVVVLSSGSRAALLGLALGLAGAALVWLAQTRGLRRRAAAAAGLGALALALLALALLVGTNASWRARVLTPATPAAPPAASANLLVASESLGDGVWWRPFVEVRRVGHDQDGFMVHELTRTEGRWFDRIQQRLRLAPNEPHTLSVDLRRPAGDGADAALIGWSAAPAEFVVRHRPEGAPAWYANGPVEVLAVRHAFVGDGWSRLEVAFASRLPEAATFEIGIAPWASDEAAPAPLEVRRLQVERGDTRTAYRPTLPPDRAGLVAASAVDTRLALYRALLGRIAERPLLGWGADAYDEVRATSPRGAFAADHEHSLPLWFALRYGIVGILAMALLLIGSAGRDPLARALVAAAFVANLADLTFFSNPFAMTLALALGVARGARAPGGALPARGGGVPRRHGAPGPEGP